MGPRLSKERWQRLDSIFQDSLDRPPAERAAFLERETAGDPGLRSEIEEMLACDAAASARIAGSVASLAQLAVIGGDWSGRRVGPYRLVRELGRGGMGIVFEAERDDAEFRQTVALKLAPAWRSQPEFLDRFRNERQILAGLDHPNIARLLDGGAEDGIPYFVMEYVDGVSLKEWRAEHTGVRESIALFRELCAAVHSAHESLVVHRDIKPANIMVNREGVPKLLDFGIARLAAPSPSAETTATAFRPWTPDYASPEQVRGAPITVRSDVYSLGLVLYELLCGERAQIADPSSPLALDRSVCETEPPLPSARAVSGGDGKRARRLRGDLDTIVATAIAKDPRRRYGSVAALSADLGRYLEGRPVQARRPTPFYRLGKLVRRRRWAFAAAALVAATATGGAVATVHQARRAERRFEQVRALANAFVFDVYDRIQFLPGATDARRAIISTALRYLESLRQDAAGDSSLALELAAAYQRIGDVQGHPELPSLHDTRGALSSYTVALRLLEPLERKGDPRAELPAAQVELKLGLVEFAEGRGQEAQASFDRARARARQILAANPNDLDALKTAGDIASEMAVRALNQHEGVRAQEAAEETVEVARRLSALQPESAAALEYLAAGQSSLGSAYVMAGDPERAASAYRESAVSRERLVSIEPSNTSHLRNLMMSYGHLADILGTPRESMGLGQLDAASEALAKATALAEEMARQDPANRTARQDLANTAYREGNVFFAQPGRAPNALAAFERSERLIAGLLAENPENETVRFLYLYMQRRIGETLEKLGRDAEAARRLNTVRATAPEFATTKDAAAASAMAMDAAIALARIRFRAGDRSAAASLAATAAAQAEALPLQRTSGAWGQAETYTEIARLFAQLGSPDKGAAWFRKSLSAWSAMKLPRALAGQRDTQVAGVEADLARLRRGQ